MTSSLEKSGSSGGAAARIKSLKNPHHRVKAWLRDDFLRRLMKNSGWLVSATGLTALIGLVGVGIKARDLGPATYGLFAVMFAYTGAMERVATPQPLLTLIKFGAEARKKGTPADFLGYVKLSLFMELAGAVVGTVVALAGAWVFALWKGWSSETIFMIAFACLTILFNVFGTATGALRVLDRFRAITAHKVAEACFTLAGTVIAYFMGWGIWGYLVTALIAAILGKCLLFALTAKAFRDEGLLPHWKNARAPDRRRFSRFNVWTYLSSALSIPVKQGDVLLVSAVLSLEAAGIYKIIKQVAQIPDMIAETVYQAVYPQFSLLIAGGDARTGLKYAFKVGIILTAVLAPVIVVVGGASPWWLGRVFGEAYGAAWPVLCLFLTYKLLTTPTLPIHPLFTAAGYVRQATWLLIASSSLYLLLTWGLSPSMGIFGVVTAWAAQQMLNAGVKVGYLAREGVKIPEKPAKKSS